MTKYRLLPETDLARIALLPTAQKRIELQRFKVGYAPYSYLPFREAVAGIFNAQKPLISALPNPTLQQVEDAIRNFCKGRPSWVQPNLKLAQTLFDYREKRPAATFEKDFRSVPIGFGAKLKFWNDFYYDRDGIPVITYMDPRRGSGLGQKGRRFAFSVMHHNLAVEDFSDAQFQIFGFPSVAKDSKDRAVTVFEFDVSQLLSEEEINEAINETYKIWQEVQEERQEETRRAANSGSGGLF